MRINVYIVFLAICVAVTNASAQDYKKVTFHGNARSLFYADKLVQGNPEPDTVTIPKLNSGHVMVDLGVDIRPNKNTEIVGMVRIRNDYGGFWGSGVTFDIRQLSVKGVVGGIVRYQLGDINYRMTKYTMWNYDQELVSNMPAIFQQQTDVVNYDHFYFNDNSRRQQGAAAECALVFRKYVQELQLHAVTTRVRTSDFGASGDRLFTGLNAQLLQSKYLELGFNYAAMYDVPGTARTTYQFRNPVLTGTAEVRLDFKGIDWKAAAEFGKSGTRFKNLEAAPAWDDRFINTRFSAHHRNSGVRLTVNPLLTGSAFRSPGAQTKRIDFGALPDAYTRVTNDQVLRAPMMLDYMRESSFYTLQLQPYLMAINPAYDNITPYGDATPNRQGVIASVDYAKENSPLTASISHAQLQEVRGEGTLKPRKFSRNLVNAGVHVNRFFSDWKKNFHVSVLYRNDQTTRAEDELVRGVDLKTNVLGIGAEAEILKGFDLMIGLQNISYEGFDFTAVRGDFSEIINFRENKIDGAEKMFAYGARYRFNENAFISAQMTNCERTSGDSAVFPNEIRQFMLLFNMKF
jgi:hypothetical protein